MLLAVVHKLCRRFRNLDSLEAGLDAELLHQLPSLRYVVRSGHYLPSDLYPQIGEMSVKEEGNTYNTPVTGNSVTFIKCKYIIYRHYPTPMVVRRGGIGKTPQTGADLLRMAFLAPILNQGKNVPDSGVVRASS